MHNQYQNFLSKAMNKNLCSYDFVHNYLFRLLIPIPQFSLVLIYGSLHQKQTHK